jgi:uncharacterized protein YbjQ (UPF0145 family)
MTFIARYFDLILFFVLLGLGYSVGRWNEVRHFHSLRTRERYLQKVLTFGTKTPPDVVSPQECLLVSGGAVISSDYFKQFSGALRSFFGGRMSVYETLLDRARREAVLRMKEQALRSGYRLIVNVRLESTTIGGVRGGVPAMEVFAYGTALRAKTAVA